MTNFLKTTFQFLLGVAILIGAWLLHPVLAVVVLIGWAFKSVSDDQATG